jgi:hypothetical protein
MCRKLGVSHLIVGGDLAEVKDEHAAYLTNLMADLFYTISREVIVLILMGNHDYLLEGMPFFRFLRHIPNVKFISTPTTMDIKGIGRCAFMPHNRHYTKKDYREICADTDWVFAHDAFRGATTESGHILDKGTDVLWFPKGSRVIAGDIHKPQKIGCVTYVGAPYTIDFGDDFDPRMLLIDEKGIVESIPCEGPQKRLVYAEAGPEPKFEFSNLYEGDILKVRVRIRAKHADEWVRIKRELEDALRKNKLVPYSIVPELIKDDKQHEKALRSVSSRKSDAQVLREFAERHQIEKRILETGQFLMEKSK